MNHQEFQQLARHKILNAKSLLKMKRWAAAFYLAGYAVECGLKACVLVQLERDVGLVFEDRRFSEKCWTHNLDQLVTLAGLVPTFEADRIADPELEDNWIIVKDWDESKRYAIESKPRAIQLFEAITNKQHGVLLWIEIRW